MSNFSKINLRINRLVSNFNADTTILAAVCEHISMQVYKSFSDQIPSWALSFHLVLYWLLKPTSSNEWTSLPQSQASQPASLAPHISFLRSSPTCTTSSGFTSNNSQAFRNIVGFGFSAATWLEKESRMIANTKELYPFLIYFCHMKRFLIS